jgi:hypothetical protein
MYLVLQTMAPPHGGTLPPVSFSLVALLRSVLLYCLSPSLAFSGISVCSSGEPGGGTAQLTFVMCIHVYASLYVYLCTRTYQCWSQSNSVLRSRKYSLWDVLSRALSFLIHDFALILLPAHLSPCSLALIWSLRPDVYTGNKSLSHISQHRAEHRISVESTSVCSTKGDITIS